MKINKISTTDYVAMLNEILFEIESKPLLQAPYLAGNNIIKDFNNRVKCYLEVINKIYSKNPHNLVIREIKSKIKSTKTLSDKISETLRLYLNGKIKESYLTFDHAITKTNINDHIYNMSVPLSVFCHPGKPLFRVRKSDQIIKERRDIFHIPFSKRYLVNAQRYSVSGLPCLYLGTSIFVCWQEMEKPDFDKLYVSSFITESGSSHRILNLGYNLRSALNINTLAWLLDNDTEGTMNRVISNLISWPLVLACNYIKQHKNSSFNPEYIIPNLLMQWLSSNENKGIAGIAYRTTKILNQKDSDIGINIIMPPKMDNILDSGYDYCPHLLNIFKFTKPVSWQVFSTLNVKTDGMDEDRLIMGGPTPASGTIEDFDESLVEYYNNTSFKKVQLLIHKMMKHDYLEP
ncbi:hypothetical protein JSP02_001395 [Escherichia coli]|nr:hypothetical protein [Escherichia coli]